MCQCKKCSSKKPPEILNLKDEVLCYNAFLVKSVPSRSQKINKRIQASCERNFAKRC